jgi:hypothetical protein
MDTYGQTCHLYPQIHATLPTLDERARRLVVAADAKTLGRGGLGLYQKASGLDHKTIQRSMRELDQGQSLPPERSRKPGGGCKRSSNLQLMPLGRNLP